MSDPCPPFKVPPAPPPPPGSPRLAAVPGGTRLISDPRRSKASYTTNRETDARTALTRGLREYLEQLQIDVPGGRQLAFRQVFSSWAEPEDNAEYPSAVVYTPVDGRYDASKFTPGVSRRSELPDGSFLMATSEMALDLTIEIWCTDPEERVGLMMLMEDALSPLDYRHGLLLELPHYHNERATYEMVSMRYEDTEIDAMRRYRKAVIIMRGSVPVVRVVKLPSTKLRTEVEVVDAVDC